MDSNDLLHTSSYCFVIPKHMLSSRRFLPLLPALDAMKLALSGRINIYPELNNILGSLAHFTEPLIGYAFEPGNTLFRFSYIRLKFPVHYSYMMTADPVFRLLQ
jgi:hypothetical protein